jgi:hypothetical protein
MRRFAFLPAALMLVAACATSQPGTPTAPPSSSPTATPVVTPSPSPLVTSAPSPVVTPEPTADPSAMTPEEQALVASLRLDVAIDCVPRRTDLPEGALRGIECRPDDPLVASVGVYEFASEIEAASTYMTRLASYGVDVRAGDCGRDIPGDSAWTPGDGEGNPEDPGVFDWENEALSPERIGCFRNENGIANVRATCGLTYIGVLGARKDLSNLTDWTWRYPAGYEPGTPDAPGICVRGS